MSGGLRIRIRGTVQGVGFRPWVFRLAAEQGITGYVRNDAEGVTIEAYGSHRALDAFLGRLQASPPPAARIRQLDTEGIARPAPEGFAIVESAGRGALEVSIPPDLAICADCLREIFDPGNRRYRYPFTNCTNCGPRFSIALDVPYDRPATTMEPFRMCEECRREYETPTDRRFHAQPNACPVCGPRLELVGADRRAVPGDPLSAAAEILAGGGVVAVKGIGGFHLACDAASDSAVALLRRRKRRDEKPFAVMVKGLAEARALAEIGETEAHLLASPAAPIVLAARRAGAALSDGVAPGLPMVGLFLAYTPLHHLLLAETATPLVMTSGNLSEEPMARTDAEAFGKLGAIADAFLVHDREIAARADDSVVRAIAGAPAVWRRSRGYAPHPIPVGRPFARPVLACGGHLKNTFCIGARDSAHLSPHVGDLEDVETFRSYEETIARAERFLRVAPEVIAHDLHPGYLSTRYALLRPESLKVPVQHHHAHVASAMAEHGLSGPVIGVAYDGTGYGTDTTAWGGEVMVADFGGFRRAGTFRPVALPGGEKAIREIWRIALALVFDAFDGAPPVAEIPLFSRLPESAPVALVREMIARHIETPLARGIGRYFDGVAALGLSRPRSSYEGQAALAWNLAADPSERGAYPWAIASAAGLPTVDLRPLVREVVADVSRGVGAPRISARFHNTLAQATAVLVRQAAREAGALPVVLTGGCFQNALLTERILGLLAPDFDVRIQREVPCGDGGLALGQALVADAVARGEGR